MGQCVCLCDGEWHNEGSLNIIIKRINGGWCIPDVTSVEKIKNCLLNKIKIHTLWLNMCVLILSLRNKSYCSTLNVYLKITLTCNACWYKYHPYTTIMIFLYSVFHLPYTFRWWTSNDNQCRSWRSREYIVTYNCSLLWYVQYGLGLY